VKAVAVITNNIPDYLPGIAVMGFQANGFFRCSSQASI